MGEWSVRGVTVANSYSDGGRVSFDRVRQDGYAAGRKVTTMPPRTNPWSYVSAGDQHQAWIRTHTDALVGNSPLTEKGKHYLRGVLEGRSNGVKREVISGTTQGAIVGGLLSAGLLEFSKLPDRVSKSKVVWRVPHTTSALLAATATATILSGSRSGVDQIKLLTQNNAAGLHEKRQFYGEALAQRQGVGVEGRARADVRLQQTGAHLTGEILIQLHALSLETFRFLQPPGKFEPVLSTPEQQVIRGQIDALLKELYSVTASVTETEQGQ